MIDLLAAFDPIPDGFGARADPARIGVVDRVSVVVPGLRRRTVDRLRRSGAVYLVPHPTADKPAPPGWTVRWEERLHYPEEDN